MEKQRFLGSTDHPIPRTHQGLLGRPAVGGLPGHGIHVCQGGPRALLGERPHFQWMMWMKHLKNQLENIGDKPDKI